MSPFTFQPITVELSLDEVMADLDPAWRAPEARPNDPLAGRR